jgi:hypothetical protein
VAEKRNYADAKLEQLLLAEDGVIVSATGNADYLFDRVASG